MPRHSSMRSLFCSSSQVPADIIDTMYPPIQKTKRASLSMASVTFLSLKNTLSISPTKASKRTVAKISIGKPSGFRHQVHVGPDTVSCNNASRSRALSNVDPSFMKSTSRKFGTSTAGPTAMARAPCRLLLPQLNPRYVALLRLFLTRY
jgi:hypothetical protein